MIVFIIMQIICCRVNAAEKFEGINAKPDSVKSFEAYFFNVTMLNSKPFIDVFYIKSDKTDTEAPETETILLLSITPEGESIDEAKALKTRSEVLNSKALKLDSEPKEVFENGLRLIGINFVGKNPRIKLSEWLDMQYFFPVKIIKYDDYGNVLDYSLLYDLNFNNQKEVHYVKHSETKFMTLNQFLKKHRISLKDFKNDMDRTCIMSIEDL